MLAPFALRGLAAKRDVIRRHAGILVFLALIGVSIFQSLVYQGLRSTTAVNAVLINCAAPLFILLSAWTIDGERPTLRQLAGILVSVTGILIILSRGEVAVLRRARIPCRRRVDRAGRGDLGHLLGASQAPPA